MGRWIDFKNDYKTLYPWFMETVWYVCKKGKHSVGIRKGVFGFAMCKFLNTNAASLFQQWAADSIKSSANQWNAAERESVYSWELCRVSEVLGSRYLAKSDSSGRTQDLSWEGGPLVLNKTNTHDVCPDYSGIKLQIYAVFSVSFSLCALWRWSCLFWPTDWSGCTGFCKISKYIQWDLTIML